MDKTRNWLLGAVLVALFMTAGELSVTATNTGFHANLGFTAAITGFLTAPTTLKS